MDIVAQILAANKPEVPVDPNIKLSQHEQRLKNLRMGHQAQTDKAIARYREVMLDKGWMTQGTIEGRLGYASTVATPFLRKLLKWGHLERRNKNGARVYYPREGYEWRWVEKS